MPTAAPIVERPQQFNFVQAVLAAATEVAKSHAIHAGIVTAQAALETGHGASIPALPDGGSSNNVLGIKAGRSWAGPTINTGTGEYTPAGEPYRTTAVWRVYPSIRECLEDYARIITGLPWYADAAAAANDARAYLEGLLPIYRDDSGVVVVVEPGYATDPNYRTKVWNIATQWDLTSDGPAVDPVEIFTRMMFRRVEVWMGEDLPAFVSDQPAAATALPMGGGRKLYVKFAPGYQLEKIA